MCKIVQIVQNLVICANFSNRADDKEGCSQHDMGKTPEKWKMRKIEIL